MCRNHSLLTLALLVWLVAATGSTALPQSPSTLRVRMANDLNQLDPTQIFDPDSQNVADAVHSHLVHYKPGTTEVEPDLATRWDVSTDGKTYTFHLRPNV
jgi:peptide/nickel transport system substrate-binding protein